MFAALHVVAGARGALAIVNLFLGVCCSELLALRTGDSGRRRRRISPGTGPNPARWAWIPNPGVGPTGALLDLDLGGPALWSGRGGHHERQPGLEPRLAVW